jgi:hypothetical protein
MAAWVVTAVLYSVEFLPIGSEGSEDASSAFSESLACGSSARHPGVLKVKSSKSAVFSRICVLCKW